MSLAVLLLSIGIQFWAAGLALLQIRRTGRILAWVLMAAALLLMGVRRSISLVHSLALDRFEVDPVAESVALLISVLMLAGVWMIRGVFDHLNRMRQSAEHEATRRERLEAELRLSLRAAEETAACLRESEGRLRFLSDNIPGGMVFQLDGGENGQVRRLLYVSKGVEALHEITVAEAQADASRIYGQLTEEDRRLVAEREDVSLRNLSPFFNEVRIQLPSGRTRWSFFASTPRRLPDNHVVWDGIEIDITARKHATEERQRTQNLQSLGTVAGGIAHDFNNLLMGVFGNLEIAEMDLEPDHPALGSLRAAHQALDHARQLSTRLLTFAKGGEPVLEAVDIRQRIQDVVRFNLTGSHVAADFDIPADLWPVKADAGQLAQVISNLVINAREAMPNGGRVQVRACNVPALKDAAVGEIGWNGDFVKLCIQDDGVGIPPVIMGQIFDPYFTTKPGGSGLGLAITHGIVNKHKGRIQVESKPGVGTSVTICLPVDEDARRRVPGLPVPLPTTGPAPQPLALRGGRVLLMDDEPLVRQVTGRMLERLGYAVDAVADGREAVVKFAAALNRHEPYHLAIVDLTVPGGMGGLDTVRHLRALDPGAKVIVASGYASDPVLADSAQYGFTGRLAKPFQLQRLEQELARVEQGKASGSGTSPPQR